MPTRIVAPGVAASPRGTDRAPAVSVPLATPRPIVRSPAELADLPPAEVYRYAEAMRAGGETRAALDAYARYGAAVPAMIDVADLGAGDALFAVGRHAEALAAYDRALAAAGDAATAFLAALRRGNALLRVGPSDAALAAYREAFDRAEDDGGRSQALAGEIAVLVAADRTADAIAVRRRLVHELPATELARAALARLEAAGEVVPAEDRAAVAAGAGDHRTALALWREAIDAVPSAPAAWILAQASSRRALGDHAVVVRLVEEALPDHADDPLAPELARRRAEALERLDRDRDAAAAYRDLAARWPRDDRAPEALRRRAWLLEALDGPLAAAEAWDDLAARYPADVEAADAGFRAGFLYWRSARVAEASERWTAIARRGAPAQQARAWYWLGRAAEDGGATDLGAGYWRMAANADPDAFYGRRALMRLGAAPAAPAPPSPGAEGPDQIGTWLSAWVPGLDGARWRDVRADVAVRRRTLRAAAYLAMGRRRSAVQALGAERAAAVHDHAALAALALTAHDAGLDDVAIACATAVLGDAPREARAAAPSAMLRLAHPDAYGALVRAEAAAQGVPAALLFAVIRQESRFDPSARSPVGASGLAQIMPATGRQIAAEIGLPGFAVGDLTTPEVSVRFGAWYLRRQLERFGGREWAALAAYNGGPGNALRWLAESGEDPDVFAETIDFRETRRYLQLVEADRAVYARLYPESQ